MRQNAFERSDLAQTAMMYLVTLAALALLGLVLAYWTWTWFAPRAEPRMRPAAEPAARAASAQALFGVLQRDRNAVALAGSAIKLLGVAAATGRRPGYAVMQLEARRSLTVREGEDVAPGIRLAEVHADHVILTRNGVRETLAWPQKTKGP